MTCPHGHQVLQTPLSVGFSQGSLARSCPGQRNMAALSCLCLGGRGLPEPLSCQPGARTGGESFVNSECDENCCICPKAREPITCEPGFRPFKNDLSPSVSVHHRLEGHRSRGRGGPPLPQPPSCPVLLAAKPDSWIGGPSRHGTPSSVSKDPFQNQPRPPRWSPSRVLLWCGWYGGLSPLSSRPGLPQHLHLPPGSPL